MLNGILSTVRKCRRLRSTALGSVTGYCVNLCPERPKFRTLISSLFRPCSPKHAFQPIRKNFNHCANLQLSHQPISYLYTLQVLDKVRGTCRDRTLGLQLAAQTQNCQVPIVSLNTLKIKFFEQLNIKYWLNENYELQGLFIIKQLGIFPSPNASIQSYFEWQTLMMIIFTLQMTGKLNPIILYKTRVKLRIQPELIRPYKNTKKHCNNLNKCDWRSFQAIQSYKRLTSTLKYHFIRENYSPKIKFQNDWLQDCFELTMVLLSFHAMQVKFRSSARVYFVMQAMQIQGTFELSLQNLHLGLNLRIRLVMRDYNRNKN